MPSRTRAADRFYPSTSVERQVTFRPRKQRIRSRPSLETAKRSRQQTLTQIDFVNLHEPFEDDEDSIYEQEISRKKRRKTEGDALSSNSKNYTQTLTQLDFVSMPASTCDSDDDILANLGSQLSTTGSAVTNALQSPQDQRVIGEQDQRFVEARQVPFSIDQPATPNRRLFAEIPSSQSPVTPFSARSRNSSEFRCPLKQMSTNTQCASRALESPRLIRSPIKPGRLEVQDSFESQGFASQLCLPTEIEESSSIKEESLAPGSQASNSGLVSHTCEVEQQRQWTPVSVEIEDSDAETSDELDTCYDDFGLETQVEAGLNDSSSELQLLDSICSSSEKELTALLEVPQFAQTQRLSTQHFDLMSPRSDKSDIIISIHPQQVQNIVSRVKDHEFRTWPIPRQVTRIWIYETKPTSSIKYMASISAAKLPGDIFNQAGLGNADFNAGRQMSRYAYEILQLYELADPVSLETAKRNSWLGGPPQKYIYVRPAVLDHLMANLRMPMFSQSLLGLSSSTEADSQEASAQLHSTMLQYTQVPLEERLSKYVDSSTAKLSRALDLLPTEQDSYSDILTNFNPRPSQATTVDLTQLSHSSAGNSQSGVKEEVLCGNVPDNDRIFQSSPIRPPLPILKSSPSLPTVQTSNYGEKPIPYSFTSSQLMTKSQMPDSLLDDSMPPPPLLVDDSDLEEE